MRKRGVRTIFKVICPVLTAIPLLFFAGGCATSECIDNKSALPYAGFYLASSGDKITVQGLNVTGVDAPNDSLLNSSSGNVFLPFRIDEDETSFKFEYNLPGAGENDTPVKISDILTFRYERQPWFVSAACGVVYNFKITDISHTGAMIDSVACPGGLITNENKENILIFFKESPSAGRNSEFP